MLNASLSLATFLWITQKFVSDHVQNPERQGCLKVILKKLVHLLTPKFPNLYEIS